MGQNGHFLVDGGGVMCHLSKLILYLSITFPFLIGCNGHPNRPATSVTSAPLNSFTTPGVSTKPASPQATAASNSDSVQFQIQTRSALSTQSDPTALVDQKWIADPKNYMKTSNPHVNKSLSVPILEYHEANYVPGDIATLKPGEFLSQLQWLHSHGFHTINFGQLYAAMYYGYQLPSRPVLLTFDDGYESIYFKVYPLLKKYHDEATLFIVSDFTHNAPDRTKKFPTLTKSELVEMQSSGLVDIESHTMDHRNLSTLPDSRAAWEISGSASFLKGIVNHKIAFFCYPDGGYTSKTVAIVKNANFLLAVTQNQGYANISQGPFTLNRISILDDTTLADFGRKLQPSLSSSADATAAVSGLFQKGLQAFSAKDYHLAISLENQAIQLDRTYYQAYNVKGIALCFSGDYADGITNINQSLQFHPDYGYGRFNKALALELYAHYDEAIQTYQQAIQLHTTDWWVAWSYYGIASIYGRRGDVPDTVRYLKQAIQINSETKKDARTEKDFDHVRNSPEFQSLIR
jgi:peptidoglycan/xylan/chitin deacetylase (PgdA/CDA1 family)